MGSRRQHPVVKRGTMKLYLISILAVWSCAEWGRVDGSNHPNLPNFPSFDPRTSQQNHPQEDSMENSPRSDYEEECCPCNQKEHGHGGGHGYKSNYGGGYGYGGYDSPSYGSYGTYGGGYKSYGKGYGGSGGYGGHKFGGYGGHNFGGYGGGHKYGGHGDSDSTAGKEEH